MSDWVRLKSLTVVGGVLLSSDHCLRVEKGAVGTGLDLLNDTRLKIDIERARHVLARTRLREESRETTVAASGLACINTTIWL